MGRNRLNELGIEDLFSPYTGLVTYIAETERLLCDPNVFVLASELCNSENFFFKNKVASNGSGAGLSYQEAYYSTLGECAERYSLSVINPDRIIFGTYNDLKDKYKITAPGLWNLFNDIQLKTLPFPKFTKDTPIGWVLADHLYLKDEFLVPACAVFLPYIPRFIDKGEQVLFPSVSTGAACYTSFNESILRGIYELIERDTFIICWRNRLRIPEIIIDEDSPMFNTFFKKFKRRHLEYKLYYTKLDFDVHSVFGMLYITDKNNTKIAINCGGSCHHDPEKAVLKTLLELVQGLKWGEYAKAEIFKPNKDFSNINSFKDRMLLYISGDYNDAFSFLQNNGQIKLSEIKTKKFKNTNDYLKDIIKALKEKEMHIFALDVTPCDIKQCNLNVVKVLIPQLETMEGNYNWQFLGKNRYKDLPVQLGYKVVENDYNTFPHPYP